VPGAQAAATVGWMSDVRYRCTACGNLTRFDVTTTRTTRAFHHYSVGGDLEVEEVEVRAETIEDVSCRWCGHGRAVEVLAAEIVELGDSQGLSGDGSADSAEPSVTA
jgi:hypothetical protein